METGLNPFRPDPGQREKNYFEFLFLHFFAVALKVLGNFKVGLSLFKKIWLNESPLKLMNNLKVLFVLIIFKCSKIAKTTM